jgi:conjugal transfer/type IV secretion protein DotA/TraY
MLDMNGVKQEIKAELKPRKVIRRALVPQFGGLMNPMKDVFSIFVRTIGLMFVQAKLIPQNHPAMTGEVKGPGAIWMMILDGSKQIKFDKQHINQLFVFYAVVGMIVFGLLSTLTFVLKLTMGSAHAQTSNGLFYENPDHNAAHWLSCLFPGANSTTGACPQTASPFVSGVTSMLVMYNTGLLVLASIFALWTIITVIAESGHHGQWGGTRHSALYWPLRIVMAIGMLVPLGNGYSSIQMIAVLLAHAGSGLADSVWGAFMNGVKSNLASNSASQVASVDWNGVLQSMIIDETCLASTYAQFNQEAAANGEDSISPKLETTSNLSISQGAITSYTIHFNRPEDDDTAPLDNNDYCGSVTVSAQISQVVPSGGTQMTANTFATAMLAVANNLLTNVAQPIVTNGPTANYTATQNPVAVANPNSSFKGGKYPWDTSVLAKNVGTSASTGTTTLDGAGNTIAQQYNTNILSPNQAAAPTDADWTQAGFVFMALAKEASDMYTVLNPKVDVALPAPEIMPGPTNSSAMQQCGKESWWAWMTGPAPYACSTEGGKVTQDIQQAIIDAQAGQQALGIVPASMNPGSIGGQATGGMLDAGMGKAILSLQSGFAIFNNNSTATNNNGTNINPAKPGTSATTPAYSMPAVGQSLFNTLYLGELIMNVAAVLYGIAAFTGIFTSVGGQIIAGFATLLFPTGAMLAIMIPLLPAIRFFFGIMTWIMTVFEALVAMPVVAVWSIKSDGEGLFAHGKEGYLLLLQMMLRPVLMLFGLIGSVLVFDTLAGFLNQTVFATWNSTWSNSNIIDQFLATVGFLYVYVTLLYSAANIAFGMINGIPDRILSWIGTGISMQTSGDSVAEQAGQGVGGFVNSGVGALAALPGQAKQIRREFDDDAERQYNKEQRLKGQSQQTMLGYDAYKNAQDEKSIAEADHARAESSENNARATLGTLAQDWETKNTAATAAKSNREMAEDKLAAADEAVHVAGSAFTNAEGNLNSAKASGNAAAISDAQHDYMMADAELENAQYDKKQATQAYDNALKTEGAAQADLNALNVRISDAAGDISKFKAEKERLEGFVKPREDANGQLLPSKADDAVRAAEKNLLRTAEQESSLRKRYGLDDTPSIPDPSVLDKLKK